MKFYMFTAPWCNPCSQMKPVVKEVMESNADVDVIFIDVSDTSNNALVEKFNIRAVPTMVSYNDEAERVVKSVAGLMNHQQLLDFFSEV